MNFRVFGFVSVPVSGNDTADDEDAGDTTEFTSSWSSGEIIGSSSLESDSSS